MNLSNIMSHYPDAKKLRVDSMTKGLSWADQEIQKIMVESARIKTEKAVSSLEDKSMYDATSYGQAWISDNIAYLSEKILEKPTTEICKSYINFPSKFRMEDGSVISTDEYIKNMSYYKAKGIRLTKPKDGANLSPEQERANEFVTQVIHARSRAMTVAFVVLTEMLDVAMSPSSETTVTAVAGHVMRNVINQLIVLKGKDLKEIMDVPSVANICDVSKWRTKRGISIKGKKLLNIMGVQSLNSISQEGLLIEGRMLMEIVCEAIPDISVTEGSIKISNACREKLSDIRLKSISVACEARPVLEKPVSDGYTNSYREAPLKDYLVGGYGYGEHVRVSNFDRDAIDRIQGTAFNINKRVLSTVKAAMNSGVVIEEKLNLPIPGDFPALEDFPKRSDYSNRAKYNEAKRVWFEEESNKKRYFKWKAKAQGRKKKQQAAVSINDMNMRTLDIAQWYADWSGPFYLPLFLDYRTRMYYMPTILNPQSSKLAKSLFIACRGKAIGTEKAMEYWLVSFAGSMKTVKDPVTGKEYAGDKTPWSLAVSAGRQELKTGAKIAADPLSQESLEIWTKQDNPFEYLAHCFECPGILEQGLEFVSSIFISMDGSCNAYQHAAGYLADRKTGELVNLTYRGPEEEPADLYGVVSEDMLSGLREDNKFHRLFKFHDVISRSSCKRITMCQGYGLTPAGAKKYGEEEIEKFTDEETETNPFDLLGREGSYEQFSSGVMDSVFNVAPAIIKVKEALQKIGELACNPLWNTSGIVSWTTYTGTQVGFTKNMEIEKRADRVSGNKRIQFVYKTYLDKVDTVSVANAQAPNYTHSRDADHMRLSIMEMPEGCSYLVVHDSFGTLAADAPLFCEKIKETFIVMYKDKEPLEGLIKETLSPCFMWVSKRTGIPEADNWNWYKEGNLEQILSECGRKGKYSGSRNSEFRRIIRSLDTIVKNVKQTKDLDFDAIMGCIYPFR